jgi:hypothetical protein
MKREQMEAQFRFERDMLPVLGTSLHDAIFPHGVKAQTMIEPGICGVIPDVLFCRWRTVPRLKLRRPATIIEAHILATIERSITSSRSALCEALFLSTSKAEESIRTLIRQGLLCLRRDGNLQIAKDANTNRASVVAVEMKLARWRDALAQASDYLRFANFAYAVLDGQRVTLSPEMVEAFSNAGVGLLLQHGSRLVIHVKATATNPPPSPERVIATHKAIVLSDYKPEYTRHFLNALNQTC